MSLTLSDGFIMESEALAHLRPGRERCYAHVNASGRSTKKKDGDPYPVSVVVQILDNIMDNIPRAQIAAECVHIRADCVHCRAGCMCMCALASTCWLGPGLASSCIVLYCTVV